MTEDQYRDNTEAKKAMGFKMIINVPKESSILISAPNRTKFDNSFSGRVRLLYSLIVSRKRT